MAFFTQNSKDSHFIEAINLLYEDIRSYTAGTRDKVCAGVSTFPLSRRSSTKSQYRFNH